MQTLEQANPLSESDRPRRPRLRRCAAASGQGDREVGLNCSSMHTAMTRSHGSSTSSGRWPSFQAHASGAGIRRTLPAGDSQPAQNAEMAAREMGGLSVADALSLCELLANTDPACYERAALR
jgi:hypothetical protein